MNARKKTKKGEPFGYSTALPTHTCWVELPPDPARRNVALATIARFRGGAQVADVFEIERPSSDMFDAEELAGADVRSSAFVVRKCSFNAAELNPDDPVGNRFGRHQEAARAVGLFQRVGLMVRAQGCLDDGYFIGDAIQLPVHPRSIVWRDERKGDLLWWEQQIQRHQERVNRWVRLYAPQQRGRFV